MLPFLKRNFSTLSFCSIAFILIFSSSNINWGKDKWKGIVEADAKGYYAYLPAIFLYQDLNYGFFDHIEKEKYFDQNYFYEYRVQSHGKFVNRYFCGTAIAEFPFFVFAHVHTLLQGGDADGFSKLYAIWVNLAAIFYLILGLYFLNKLLVFYKIKEFNRVLTIWAITFGTNLFYYAALEPGMSHTYSFCFISIFFCNAKQFFLQPRKKTILILALLLGFIVLIRPINGIVIFFLPFLAGSVSTFSNGFAFLFKNKISLVLSALAACFTIFLQLLIYKISTGFYFIDAYSDIGFNFLDPHFMDILFSYKKGLFLYTPIYFVSLLGLYFLAKKSKFQGIAWLSFFLFLTYLLSSWSMWYYGGSFSSRVYVDYLSIFAVLLAVSMEQTDKTKWRKPLLTLIVSLSIICQIQTFQYRYMQIHWSEMNKEKYWDVFLRIDQLI